MSSLVEIGRRVQAEMLGDEFVARNVARQEAGEFGSIVGRHAHEACFGAVWAREGLDRRSRSIATIAMLIGLRTHDELKNHFKAGIANGLTPQEIEELLLHAVPYLGYPSVALAIRAATEALTEIGKLPPPRGA